MRRKVCRLIIGVYLLIYLAALIVAFGGLENVLGSGAGRGAGILLVILGVPFSLTLGLPENGFPETIGQVIVVLSPVFNGLIAYLLCPKTRKRDKQTPYE